jgi:glutathione S-transferase
MQKEMTMITLYDFPLSGHAHRVRLMLSLLNLDYELVQVDLTRGEQKTPDFLQLNPFGVVPVLVDGDLVLRESTAILTYLARIYGPQWLPIEPVAMAEVQTWLATANKDVVTGPGAARLVTVFNAPLDHAALISKSHELLTTIDTWSTASGSPWSIRRLPTWRPIPISPMPLKVMSPSTAIPTSAAGLPPSRHCRALSACREQRSRQPRN